MKDTKFVSDGVKHPREIIKRPSHVPAPKHSTDLDMGVNSVKSDGKTIVRFFKVRSSKTFAPTLGPIPTFRRKKPLRRIRNY